MACGTGVACPRCTLGGTAAGRRGCVHRVDRRREHAAPQLARASRRQEPRRRTPRSLSTRRPGSKPARHAKIAAHFEPGRRVAAMTGAASSVLTTAASPFSPRTSRLLPWTLVCPNAAPCCHGPPSTSGQKTHSARRDQERKPRGCRRLGKTLIEGLGNYLIAAGPLTREFRDRQLGTRADRMRTTTDGVVGPRRKSPRGRNRRYRRRLAAEGGGCSSGLVLDAVRGLRHEVLWLDQRRDVLRDGTELQDGLGLPLAGGGGV